MTVLHHVIKSLGTRYDPLAGKVVAHIVGGGSVGNTQFQDISTLRTPCVTTGTLKGASASGPFGPAVSLKGGGGAAAMTLHAEDPRYKLVSSATPSEPLDIEGPFTIDGWFKCDLPTTNTGRIVWCMHGTGFSGAGWSWAGASNGATMALSLSGSSTSPRLSVRRVEAQSDGFGGVYYVLTEYAVVNLTSAAQGQWVYYHLYYPKPGGPGTLNAFGRPPATDSGVGYWSSSSVAMSISLGAFPNGAQITGGGTAVEFYTFRLTLGHRPYDAALLTSPWPTPGGTQNWLGAPAGSSTPIGQKVLANGEVWVVPPGITSFSAVAVGCKLSIAGADVLAATWPVLGDGGGQGGAGGTGHSNTVTSWSNGPPTASFGGGSGTVRTTRTYTYYGGGGGAGGYAGNGGHGVNTQGATASAGSGGGGGGGATQAWGGGVGLKGQGASGTGGSNPGQPGSANGTTYGGGKPGSSGTVNGAPGNNLAWRNNITVTQGQVVLCTYIGQSGQTGAARIMWGDARSYPSNAGDVE